MKTLSALTLLLLSGCQYLNGDSSTYTLYRNSPVVQDIRIHVATFDSNDGETYNRDNCETARELFQKQPGVVTKFWCEKGSYRK